MVAGLKNNTHQLRVKRLQTWSYFLLCRLSSPDPLSLRQCVINSSESIESAGEHRHLSRVISQRSWLRQVALCYLSLPSLDLGLFTKIAFAAVDADTRRFVWVVWTCLCFVWHHHLACASGSLRILAWIQGCKVRGRRRRATLRLGRLDLPLLRWASSSRLRAWQLVDLGVDPRLKGHPSFLGLRGSSHRSEVERPLLEVLGIS